MARQARPRRRHGVGRLAAFHRLSLWLIPEFSGFNRCSCPNTALRSPSARHLAEQILNPTTRYGITVPRTSSRIQRRRIAAACSSRYSLEFQLPSSKPKPDKGSSKSCPSVHSGVETVVVEEREGCTAHYAVHVQPSPVYVCEEPYHACSFFCQRSLLPTHTPLFSIAHGLSPLSTPDEGSLRSPLP